MTIEVISKLSSEGDEFLLDGDLKKALEKYSEASKLAPEDIKLAIKCARVTYEDKIYDECIKYSNQVLEIEPGNPRSLIYKGKSLYQLGKKVEARTSFIKIPRKDLTDELNSMIVDCNKIMESMSDYELVAGVKAKKAIELKCKFSETNDFVNLEFSYEEPNAKQIDVKIRSKYLSIYIDFGYRCLDRRFTFKNDVNEKDSTHSKEPQKIVVTIKKSTPCIWGKWEDAPITAEDLLKSSKDGTSGSFVAYNNQKQKLWEDLGNNAEDECVKELDGESASMHALHKIFEGSTDEQRLAMSKSFQESNGTALITDPKKALKKRVKIDPPDEVRFVPYN